MKRNPRRTLLKNPQSAWEAELDEASTLEEAVMPERSRSGEIEPGDEERGGGDKGIDADTGDGGYGGDAALEGLEDVDPERPVDSELHGDPRTHEGQNYPHDQKLADPHQRSIGREAMDEEDDEDATS